MKSLCARGRWLESLALTLVLSSLSRADTITLADGKRLENVLITSETWKDETFQQDGKSKSVSSDSVSFVTFAKKPALVEQADASAREGDVSGAMDTLETYLVGIQANKSAEPLLWAQPYAMQRLVELAVALDDKAEVIKAADRLIQGASESRYLPGAYLSKARALSLNLKPNEALAVIGDLRKRIARLELGERWKLEAQVAGLLFDPAVAGSLRRARLLEISAATAKAYPTVALHLRLAEAESSLSGESVDFTKAKTLFEQAISDPIADEPTLAWASTGLGDCLLAQANLMQQANQDASANLNAAKAAYMSVVVLYPEQVRYRAKSMFFAGRAFSLLGDDVSKARARLLYRAVIRDFKDSSWAGEAQKLLGG